MKPFLKKRSGIALIMTLAVLGMLMVLLMAFVVMVRVEKRISRSSSDDIRAQLAAQAGMGHALQLITMFTTNGTYVTYYTNRNWATPTLQSPILCISNWTMTTFPIHNTNLISDAPVSTTTNNLNFTQAIAAPSHFTNLLNIGWAYLADNGVTNARYAFWCDDESMKINLRVGGTNVASFGTSLLEMGITNIPGIGPDGVSIMTSRDGGFETLETLREYSFMDQGRFNQAKFYSTIYSMDSGSNAIGSPKLNINSYATSNIFQISEALSNAFPIITQKYTNGYEWLQFCANLKEWMNPVSTPASAIIVTTPHGPFPLIGRNSTPLINQVTFKSMASASVVAPNATFYVTNIISVQLVNLYATPYVFPPNSRLSFSNMPMTSVVGYKLPGLTYDFTDQFTTGQGGWPDHIHLDGLVLAPFGAATYAETQQNIAPVSHDITFYTGADLTRATTNIWAYLTTNDVSISGFGMLDVASLNVATQAVFIAPVPIPGIIETNMVLISPGDPKIAKNTNMWTYVWPPNPPTLVGNTFHPDATPNPPFYYGDSNNVFQVQAEGGFFFRNGPMQSIGEIGCIPVQWNHTNRMWQTIKLYGDGNASNPTNHDYNLLDFITVSSAPRARVNVNTTKEYLGTNGVLSSLFERASVSVNASGTSGFSNIPANVAANLALDVVDQGQTIPAVPTPYRSIGHFILLNSNLFCTNLLGTAASQLQDTDWRREGPIRSIANALTIRGEQFTIYSLGQSIQIVPGFRTNVLATTLTQTVVERPQGSPVNTPYKIIYQKRH